jgi:ankyrin repeat protein
MHARTIGGFLLPLFLGSALIAAQPQRARREVPMADAERYLLAAARTGDTVLIEGLVKAGALVDARDERGFTPLILAAYHDQGEAVSTLLRLGADACAHDAHGNSALMGAAFKGHEQVVALLLREPCAVDQANGVGQTALMFARLFGRSAVADLLVAAGASRTRRDSSGRSADDWAHTQEPGVQAAAPR